MELEVCELAMMVVVSVLAGSVVATIVQQRLARQRQQKLDVLMAVVSSLVAKHGENGELTADLREVEGTLEWGVCGVETFAKVIE